jgi:hypothetical protein
MIEEILMVPVPNLLGRLVHWSIPNKTAASNIRYHQGNNLIGLPCLRIGVPIDQSRPNWERVPAELPQNMLLSQLLIAVMFFKSILAIHAR